MTPGARSQKWSPEMLGPDLANLARVLLLLALVGGAVFVTGQIMRKAQDPARRLLGIK